MLDWKRRASQVLLVVKNLPANAGDIRDIGLIPRWRRFSGGGHGNLLQYFCWENPVDKGAWWAAVHRVAKSRTWLKWLSTHTHPWKRKKVNSIYLWEVKSYFLPSFCFILWVIYMISIYFSMEAVVYLKKKTQKQVFHFSSSWGELSPNFLLPRASNGWWFWAWLKSYWLCDLNHVIWPLYFSFLPVKLRY